MDSAIIRNLRLLLDSLPEGVVFNVYSTTQLSYSTTITILFMRDGKMCMIDFRLIEGAYFYTDKFITYDLRHNIPSTKAKLNEILISLLK